MAEEEEVEKKAPADEGGPPPTPKWIVTFTDLMSLLLTFFILLLTFSTPAVEKLFDLRGSISGTFGIFDDAKDDRDSFTPASPMRIGRDQRNPFAPAQRPRFRPLEEHEPNDQILRLRDQTGQALLVDAIDEGYRIRIADAVAFAPAEMYLSAESYARLGKLAKAIEFMKYHLIVVAYIGGSEEELVRARGHNPMDFSIQRAVKVARRLVEAHGVNPNIIAVAGYGTPHGDGTDQGHVEFIMSKRTQFLEAR